MSEPNRTDPLTPAPVDRTDRRRLEQIQAQDLTESRVNQDFLDWLKTKGMNWLLVVLLAICGLMGWNILKDRRAQSRALAWAEFDNALTPVALEDLAAMHGSVDALGGLALLRAGEQYLTSVQSGRRFDRAPDAEDAQVTPELATEWLGRARDLFTRAEAAARSKASSIDTSGILISALFGQAAVAESLGDLAGAKRALEQAQQAATPRFEPLATLAKGRIGTLDTIEKGSLLPARASLPRESANVSIPTTVVDERLLQELSGPAIEIRRVPAPPIADLPMGVTRDPAPAGEGSPGTR
ncbi:MAG TPA: hypothetical protein PKC43_09440 [Phycisphaerales bacterium]|nr:hypothetical protein [Phycisphaerales bacterium]HMP37657.1 hypothetical protein [Phycisphaerales bacterium]